MKNFLLDTHTLIWFITAPERLPKHILAMILSPESRPTVSFATLWEMSIKMALGKMPAVQMSIAAVAATMEQQSIDLLLPQVADLTVGMTLPLHHRDPFDRLLIAQALRLGVPVLSVDAKFRAYGLEVIW